MPAPKRLIHSEWFDEALQRLGSLRDVETVLAKEFYRLACYADLVPLASDSAALRIYQTAPLLREDGGIVRVLIYFVLRDKTLWSSSTLRRLKWKKLERALSQSQPPHV